MSSGWAEENLKVIRQLMERTALYRRALGPISIWIGVIGFGGATLGFFAFPDLSPSGFTLFWLLHATAAICGGFAIMRRQALKDHEPLFSPPAKRVLQALAPGLTAGLVGVIVLWSKELSTISLIPWIVFSWMALYGCAVHAAGFFMPRGIKWFGWIFIGSTLILSIALSIPNLLTLDIRGCHMLMGIVFGGFHLAYGIYLQITESQERTS